MKVPPFIMVDNDLFDTFLSKSGNLTNIYLHLKRHATYVDEREIFFHSGERLILKKDQLITSARNIAKALLISKDTANRGLKKLADAGIIAIEHRQDYSIVTMVYQTRDTPPVSFQGHPPHFFDTPLTYSDTPPTHNETPPQQNRDKRYIEINRLNRDRLNNNDSTCAREGDSGEALIRVKNENQINESLQDNEKPTALPLESEKNREIAPPPPKRLKTRITTWDENDQFAQVFSNLNRLSICKVKFDREDYRSWLIHLMETLSLTLQELNSLSFAWQEYHNERTQKPKVVKASFRTWIANYIERRDKSSPGGRKTGGRTVQEWEKRNTAYFDDLPF